MNGRVTECKGFQSLKAADKKFLMQNYGTLHNSSSGTNAETTTGGKRKMTGGNENNSSAKSKHRSFFPTFMFTV
jgi:hypothetical protein